jgi:hypothetical protein
MMGEGTMREGTVSPTRGGTKKNTEKNRAMVESQSAGRFVGVWKSKFEIGITE